MTHEQIDQLITALNRLSFGDAHKPSGFEALAMSIAGERLHKPLSEAVESVADSLQSIADNIDRLIDEIKNLKYNI